MKNQMHNAPMLIAALALAACGGSGGAQGGAEPAAKEQSAEERALLAACDATDEAAGDLSCKCLLNAAKKTLSDADYEAFVRLTMITMAAGAPMETFGGGMAPDDNIFARRADAAAFVTDLTLTGRMPRIMAAMETAMENCSVVQD